MIRVMNGFVSLLAWVCALDWGTPGFLLVTSGLFIQVMHLVSGVPYLLPFALSLSLFGVCIAMVRSW